MTSGGSKYSRFLSTTFLQNRVRLFLASIQSQTRVHGLCLSHLFIGTEPVRNSNSY